MKTDVKVYVVTESYDDGYESEHWTRTLGVFETLAAAEEYVGPQRERGGYWWEIEELVLGVPVKRGKS